MMKPSFTPVALLLTVFVAAPAVAQFIETLAPPPPSAKGNKNKVFKKSCPFRGSLSCKPDVI
jgi:hypothetical protein